MLLKISDFINEYNFDYLLKKIQKINTIIKIFTHFLFYFAIFYAFIFDFWNFIFFIVWIVFYIFVYENRFVFLKYIILKDKNFYNFLYSENFDYTKQIALDNFLQKLKSITWFNSSFLPQKLDYQNLKTEENFLKFLYDLEQEIKQNQKIIIFNSDFDFADTLLTRIFGIFDWSRKNKFKNYNQNLTFSFIFKFLFPPFIVFLMLVFTRLFADFIYLDFFKYFLYFVFILVFLIWLKYFFFYTIIEKINSKIPFYNYYFNEWLVLEKKIKFYFANWQNFSKKNDYNSLLFATLINKVNQNISFRSEFLQKIEKSQKYKKYIYYSDLQKILDLQKNFLKENSIFIQKVVYYWSEKNVEFNQNLISDLSENSNFDLQAKRLEILNQNLGKLQK